MLLLTDLTYPLAGRSVPLSANKGERYGRSHINHGKPQR
jgi:hypothetical protein